MSEVVCAGVFTLEIEAELFKSALEARGIKANVLGGGIGGMYPGVGGARVLVNEEDLEKAKAVLNELEE